MAANNLCLKHYGAWQWVQVDCWHCALKKMRGISVRQSFVVFLIVIKTCKIPQVKSLRFLGISPIKPSQFLKWYLGCVVAKGRPCCVQPGQWLMANKNTPLPLPKPQTLKTCSIKEFPLQDKAEIHISMVQEFKTCAELLNYQWALWREPQWSGRIANSSLVSEITL